jgi:hypothetical protein
VPARPPILCPGCPHRSVYSVLNKLKIHAAGDIGCYTLGAVAPLSVVDTTVCMGASISTLHGMEKAKGKDYIKNWVAVIGDSTFLHTGVNSLMNMIYNKSTGTVMILDNSTTGMTGHQDHSATGKTLLGETTNAVNLMELCKALGVKHVQEVNAFDIATLEKVASLGNDLSISNTLEALGAYSYEMFFELANSIIDGNQARVAQIVSDIYSKGNDLKLFVDSFFTFCLDVAKYCLFKDTSMIGIPESYEENLKNSINFDSPEKYYMHIVDRLLELKVMIKNDTSIRTTVEATFLRMARWQ